MIICIIFQKMSEIKELSSINGRQREEILNIKSRLESKINKINSKAPALNSSPLPPSIHISNPQQIEPSHDYADSYRNQSFSWNSTLLKHFNNESLEEGQSEPNLQFQSTEEHKQSNLILKIDEIIEKSKKKKGKVPEALYQQFLSDQETKRSDDFKGEEKLETIQEERGNTATTNKQTTAEKNKQQKQRKSHRPPLNSVSIQKQKIREAMSQIKQIEKSDNIEIQDKDSIIFDLSDNDSDDKPEKQQKKKFFDKYALIKQKQELQLELAKIEKQLSDLEQEESEI